jgi:hypothetical protein
MYNANPLLIHFHGSKTAIKTFNHNLFAEHNNIIGLIIAFIRVSVTECISCLNRKAIKVSIWPQRTCIVCDIRRVTHCRLFAL